MWTNSSLPVPFGITTRIEETWIRYALYMCVCVTVTLYTGEGKTISTHQAQSHDQGLMNE